MRDDECLYALEFTHNTDVQDNTDIVRLIESALSFIQFSGAETGRLVGEIRLRGLDRLIQYNLLRLHSSREWSRA